MTKWHKRFLELARHVADWSKDPRTKVGSVIVDSKHRVVSLGYNGFPRGVLDIDERYDDRDVKLKYVCHAERNALDNSPHSVEGCTLYATYMPCNECAKSIIQRGIKTVVTVQPELEKDPFQWTRFNWEFTIRMFDEAGVEVVYVD